VTKSENALRRGYRKPRRKLTRFDGRTAATGNGVGYNGGRERGAKAYPVARARWRRCFALSLAFRLFARIVLLDLAVFFGWGSDLDGDRRFLADIRHRAPLCQWR
jgi:hypothetical protein